MEFLKTFFDQVIIYAPKATKVTRTIGYINSALKELESDYNIRTKTIYVLQEYFDVNNTKIDIDSLMTIVDIVTSNVTNLDIKSICCTMLNDPEIVAIIKNYITYEYISPEEVNHLAEFIVEEVNKTLPTNNKQ